MKTDIQIAQEATMLPIKDVAANYGITEDDLDTLEIKEGVLCQLPEDAIVCEK